MRLFIGLLLLGCAAAQAVAQTQCITPSQLIESSGGASSPWPEAETFAELMKLYQESIRQTTAATPTAPTVPAPTAAVGGRRMLLQTACPLKYNPQCGADRKTYDNPCLADAAGVAVAHAGPCVSDPLPPANATAGGGFAKPCPAIYAPVCGVDNTTYGSDCMAEGAGVEIAHTGECGTRAGADVGAGAGAAAPCPLIYAPVCDTATGREYANECVAAASGVAAFAPGACPAGAGATGAAPVACPMSYIPVCGVSNATYANDCLAYAARDAVACRGACPCPDLVAKLGSVGGVAFIPVDDALLSLLANLTEGGDWTRDPAVQRVVLARHLALGQGAALAPPPVTAADGGAGVLAPGAGDDVLAPGAVFMTEASTFVKVLAQQLPGGAFKFLEPLGGGVGVPAGAGEPVRVLDSRTVCNLTAVLIEAPLMEAA
eukprot:scaffold17.g518.t1